ncbi:MAG: ABC transporter ATP-binding protein [Gordonia sp. (in: high G+C Gram-positive bacteria)]
MTTLSAKDIHLSYGRGRNKVHALSGVSLSITTGRSVGIAGESGSGKSTLARVLLGASTPDEGSVTIDGEPLLSLPARGPNSRARRVQMIYQNPGSSLNQRMTVGDTLLEALNANRHGVDADKEVRDVLDFVGLESAAQRRYPFQFSGGQKQRIAIARALIVKPQALICDEPTSALDVSVQASIMLLLKEVRQQTGLALAVITHNLDVVHYLCDDVAIMRHGKIVECGPTSAVFDNPQDGYTRTLIGSLPRFSHVPFSGIAPAQRPRPGDLAALRQAADTMVATHSPNLTENP